MTSTRKTQDKAAIKKFSTSLMSKRRLYRLSKVSQICVEEEPQGQLYTAVIDQAELDRIACLADIPKHKIDLFEERIRFLLCSWAMGESEPRYTKRQLINELSKLANHTDEATVPSIPEWVWTEIGRTELRRQQELEIGPIPIRAETAEQASEIIESSERARVRMVQRLATSRRDLNELRTLAHDVHAAVSARGELTREQYATKRALEPGRSYITDNIFGFWTEGLGRPGQITKQLIAFTDVVYRLCGIEMQVATVKGRLVRAKKRTRN